MGLSYKQAIAEAMRSISKDDRVVFIGQSVRYSGHVMFNTLEGVSMDKRIELPVFEDTQLGMCTGWSLRGYVPISIFPRMDFLIIAANQLINHLDKIEEMSNGEFKPHVIIRTMVGSKYPLNPGPQHYQDHTESLRLSCPNIRIIRLQEPQYIKSEYEYALNCDRSSIMVEYGDLYG